MVSPAVLGELSATLFPALSAMSLSGALVAQADLTASRLAQPKPQQPKVPGELKGAQALAPVSAALPPL